MVKRTHMERLMEIRDDIINEYSRRNLRTRRSIEKHIRKNNSAMLDIPQNAEDNNNKGKLCEWLGKIHIINSVNLEKEYEEQLRTLLDSLDIKYAKDYLGGNIFIIIGNGDLGGRVEEYIKENFKYPQILFCDMSVEESEDINSGRELICLEDAVQKYLGCRFIVANNLPIKQVTDHLLKLGVPGEDIIVDLPSDIL